MIVEREYYVKLSEIGKENKITNKALLGILEDIGGVHSNIAGYGIPTMDKTHLTWILLDWKVQVIRRPNYGEKIKETRKVSEAITITLALSEILELLIELAPLLLL